VVDTIFFSCARICTTKLVLVLLLLLLLPEIFELSSDLIWSWSQSSPARCPHQSCARNYCACCFSTGPLLHFLLQQPSKQDTVDTRAENPMTRSKRKFREFVLMELNLSSCRNTAHNPQSKRLLQQQTSLSCKTANIVIHCKLRKTINLELPHKLSSRSYTTDDDDDDHHHQLILDSEQKEEKRNSIHGAHERQKKQQQLLMSIYIENGIKNCRAQAPSSRDRDLAQMLLLLLVVVVVVV
jgi:hypothetical protein